MTTADEARRIAAAHKHVTANADVRLRMARVVVALDEAIGSLYHRDDEPMTADSIRRHRETLDRLRAMLDEVTP